MISRHVVRKSSTDEMRVYREQFANPEALLKCKVTAEYVPTADQRALVENAAASHFPAAALSGGNRGPLAFRSRGADPAARP
jgi:hypothetical protein